MVNRPYVMHSLFVPAKHIHVVILYDIHKYLNLAAFCDIIFVTYRSDLIVDILLIKWHCSLNVSIGSKTSKCHDRHSIRYHWRNSCQCICFIIVFFCICTGLFWISFYLFGPTTLAFNFISICSFLSLFLLFF